MTGVGPCDGIDGFGPTSSRFWEPGPARHAQDVVIYGATVASMAKPLDAPFQRKAVLFKNMFEHFLEPQSVHATPRTR
jgi:hypothetical protein